jgi:hypothetical protein
MRIAELERQKKKGMVSSLGLMQGRVLLGDAEAERETRQAELKDVESRYHQAKRRMVVIDRDGGHGQTSIHVATSQDRLARMERELDRLRPEMDAALRGDLET